MFKIVKYLTVCSLLLQKVGLMLFVVVYYYYTK